MQIQPRALCAAEASDFKLSQHKTASPKSSQNSNLTLKLGIPFVRGKWWACQSLTWHHSLSSSGSRHVSSLQEFVSPHLQQQLCLSGPPQVFCRYLLSQHWAIQQLPPSIHLSGMNKQVTCPIRWMGAGFVVREWAPQGSAGTDAPFSWPSRHG